MASIQRTGLSSNRVHDPHSANVGLLECCICRELLWKPVACQECETPFCSACITGWLTYNPNKCPNRCEVYIERKCPPMVTKLLAQLQITCFYRSNGCQEVPPYEALDKHEIDCGYQFQQCVGCHSQTLKKDLNTHEKNCGSIKLTCEDCQLVYERSEAARKHTENICLREQLRQVREESKENKRVIQELTRLLNGVHVSKIVDRPTQEVIIRFDDLPSAKEENKPISDVYTKLKWSGISYGHESYMKEKYPTSGYAICFTNNGSPHIAYFKDEGSISIQHPNEIFTFISLNACAAWNDNLQLTIIGHRQSTQTRTYSTTLEFGKPQVILLQWKDIDKIVFKSSGGTAHPGSGGRLLSQVIITQLTIS